MAISNVPDVIKVAGFDIHVEQWTHHEASMVSRFAEFACLTQTIKIDGTLSKIKFIDSLIHEINHAIYWAYHIEDEDKEERIVSTFATAWTQIYRDNPKLIRFIDRLVKQL